MKGHQFKSWIFELREILREIKNSHYFLDSWTNSIQRDLSFTFFSTKNYPTFTQFTGFNKQSIFHDQGCSTLCGSGPYISYYQSKYGRKKNLYLIGLLPIPMNSIGSRNDTLEKSFWSSNINRLIVSLLYLPKGKRFLKVISWIRKRVLGFFQ
ncbi:Protein Ycf2 [Bienertia sinuspersici]